MNSVTALENASYMQNTYPQTPDSLRKMRSAHGGRYVQMEARLRDQQIHGPLRVLI